MVSSGIFAVGRQLLFRPNTPKFPWNQYKELPKYFRVFPYNFYAVSLFSTAVIGGFCGSVAIHLFINIEKKNQGSLIMAPYGKVGNQNQEK